MGLTFSVDSLESFTGLNRGVWESETLGSASVACRLPLGRPQPEARLLVVPREGIDQSYQLLRDSLDLYLAMYPDQVQLLLLQARLYFHLGIWPEKVIILLCCWALPREEAQLAPRLLPGRPPGNQGVSSDPLRLPALTH